MAITGTLLADFSAFDAAAQKTEARLEAMAKAAGGTTTEVTAADKALQGLGATATTSTAPALTTVGTTAGTTTGKVLSFQQSFQQVDKTLAAVGVNLGPLPAAITELGSAVGKTAGELGALQTAGLAAAAFLGGWTIGKKIDEWTGWSDAIGRTTAKLLGWGDVAAVEAAEGARTLEQASKLAGREITSMDEAIRIITADTKTYVEDAKLQAAALDRIKLAAEQAAEFSGKLFSLDDIARADQYVEALGGVENITRLTKDKKEELRKAIGDALAAYKALGTQAPPELQKIYDATTELIGVSRSFSDPASGMWAPYKEGLDDAVAKTEVATAQMRLKVEAAEAPWRELGGTSREELQAIADTAAAKYATALAHSDHFTAQQIADFKRVAEEAQTAANNWGTALEQKYEEVADAGDRAADRQVAAAQRVSLTWSEAMDAVRRGEGTMSGQISLGSGPVSQSEMAAAEAAHAAGNYFGPVTNVKKNAWGGVISSDIDWGAINAARGVPAASAAGGGGVNTNVTVNGSVLSNPRELAKVVGDAVMSSLRAGGVRLPAGA